MIPADRLEAYTGPFYTTPHGDRVHMTSYCHGQRSAMGASKRSSVTIVIGHGDSMYLRLQTTHRVSSRGGVQIPCAISDFSEFACRAGC